MADEEKTLVERPNKSQLKREQQEMQLLIDRMTGLTDKELLSLGMTEDGIEEVARVRALRPSGARNRQIKYCVKQMQREDLSEVIAYLTDRRSQQLAVNQAFHELEMLRERLLEEGDKAMGELLARWPDLDRQQLRQMVRDAQREKEKGKPVGAGKKLFRYLRELAESEGG